jgi:chaperonin GroES
MQANEIPKLIKEEKKMAKVNIKPLGDRVLVEQVEEVEQVKGGIVIPDSAKEKPQEATVVALGTGGKDDNGKKIPFDVKVGDLVLTSKYGGTDVKINDKEYKILSSSDILAVVG